MKIPISDLVIIVDRLFQAIRANPKISIELGKKDFYWDIATTDLYNIDCKPTNFFLQQLSDDWEELLRLKKETEKPITYDLKRLAMILRSIEESHTIALT